MNVTTRKTPLRTTRRTVEKKEEKKVVIPDVISRTEWEKLLEDLENGKPLNGYGKEKLSAFDNYALLRAEYLGNESVIENIRKILEVKKPKEKEPEIYPVYALDTVRNPHLKWIEMSSDRDSFDVCHPESFVPYIRMDSSRSNYSKVYGIGEVKRGQASPEYLIDFDFITRFYTSSKKIIIYNEVKSKFRKSEIKNNEEEGFYSNYLNYVTTLSFPRSYIYGEEKGPTIINVMEQEYLEDYDYYGVDEKEAGFLRRVQIPPGARRIENMEYILIVRVRTEDKYYNLEKTREIVDYYDPFAFSCYFDLPREEDEDKTVSFYSGEIMKVPWSKSGQPESRLYCTGKRKIIDYDCAIYDEVMAYYHQNERMRYYLEEGWELLSNSDHCESCFLSSLIKKKCIERSKGEFNVRHFNQIPQFTEVINLNK